MDSSIYLVYFSIKGVEMTQNVRRVVMGWELEVDVGPIQHPTFGKALNLKAKLPLLSNCDYELPAVDRDRLDEMTLEVGATFKHFAGHKKVGLPLLMAIYQNPTLDWEQSAGLRAMVNLMVHAILLDDIVDSAVSIMDGVTNYRILLAFISVLGQPHSNLDSFLPQIVHNGSSEDGNVLEVLLNGFSQAISALSQHAKDAGEMEHLLEESNCSAISSYLSLAAKSKPSMGLSNVTYRRSMGQFVHGMRMAVEGNALLTGVASVPPVVRKTLLFQMLMDSFGNGTALLNAIVGVKRDVAENAWKDSSILRNVIERGWGLEQSFSEAVDSFCAEVRDMEVMLEILEETYGDVEGVAEFLRVVQCTFMGTCLSYADQVSRERYLGVNVTASDVTSSHPPI